MAKDNKTISDVCARMRECAAECTSHGCVDMESFADEIEAVHKRAIAAKDAEIAELRDIIRWFDGLIAECRNSLKDVLEKLKTVVSSSKTVDI